MENGNARFRVSAGQKAIEIEGSEKFVKEQLNENRDIVNALQEKIENEKSAASARRSEPATTSRSTELDEGSDNDPAEAKYRNVIDCADDKVRIITDIPGESKRAQTQNAALLCLVGKEMMGEDRASFEEISQICKDHGFHDRSNFADNVKSVEGLKIHGSGQSMEAELTFPGRKTAEDLAQELNG